MCVCVCVCVCVCERVCLCALEVSCVYCNYYFILLGPGLHSYHSEPVEVHETSTTIQGEVHVCQIKCQ